MGPPAKDPDERQSRPAPDEASSDSADDAALRDLMKRYQAGEIEAFEALHATLAPRLSGFFGRQRLDWGADRDDLVQATFLQMHRARHTYSPTRPAAPWIFAIARHVYRMDRRSRRRKQGRETNASPLEHAAVDSPAHSAEARDALARGLAATTLPRRTALLLHHYWGLTFREIGRLLGVRTTTARLRSSRGARDVRRRLDEEDEP